MQKAKLFWNGRSQAVRLPKEFRFDADEVLIRREGDTVILELPKKTHEDEWAWLDAIVGPVDEDVVAAVNEDPGEPTPRPEVDKFFK